jgi:putative NADH-flavin reductase
MNIAILGAPGCVGQNLIKKLLKKPEHKVIASYRTENEIPEDLQHDHLAWKQVNLLDESSARSFLRGAEILIYLIQSLGAKNFEQLDIQLANAAGKASPGCNKKTIYLDTLS